MGQGKSPWYTHRLMHRKRVTCELHDSYFRLMTIKHAIPKIEWAIELLYNSVKTGSQWVGSQRSRRQDVVEKATAQRRGPSGPPLSWKSDELVIRCDRESKQKAEPPGLRLSIRRRERYTATSGGAGEIKMLQSLFGLQLPLTHANLTIKWEVYFFKEVFPRPLLLCRYDSFCMNLHMRI